MTALLILLFNLNADAQFSAGPGSANGQTIGSLGFPTRTAEETLVYAEEQTKIAKEKEREAEGHLAEAKKLEGCASCRSAHDASIRLYGEASSAAYEVRNNAEGATDQLQRDSR